MTPRPDWALVIPVRGGAGKSRLEVEELDRAALSRAMALDTVAAVVECTEVGSVTVVTADPSVISQLPVGVKLVSDPGTGLSGAIRAGLAAVPERLDRAVLLGDLPALRAEDLAEALRAASTLDLAFVADAEGTGTTLLTARAGASLQPAFGPDSARRHREGGHRELRGYGSLHHDVDDVSQLRTAAGWGLGPRTAALLAQGASSSVA